MADPVWLEIAREQYAALPAQARDQVDARIGELLENPRPPDAGYDEPTDQCTTIYGHGVGLIVYAVVPAESSSCAWSSRPRTALLTAFTAACPCRRIDGE